MPDHQDRHGRPRQVYRAAEQPERTGEAHNSTPQKNTEKTAQKPQNNSPKNTKEFFRKNQRNLLVGGGILMLVVVLLLVMLIPACSSKPEAVSSLPSLVTSETEVEQTEFEREAPIAAEHFQGTILSETEDAGQEYVDDTLFLGDSNTVRMLNYRDVTGVSTQNAIGVVGMGIQSVTSYKCVKYEGLGGLITMPEAVAVTQPRRVVITFGTNNVGGMGVDTFIGHYEDAIEAIQEAYEYADIIIGAVFPVDANCSASGITLEKIDNYNAALAELADRMECKFLYWSEALESTNGYAVGNYTVSDGYHISRDGMEALFDYMRTHAYIREDDRPALKPVPKRLDADVDLIKTDGNTNTVPGQAVSMPQIEEPPVVEEPVQEAATVYYNVWDDTNATSGGGSVSVNGGTYSSYTYECYVGEGAPGATAVPADGYRFAYWSTNAGVDTGSASVGGFTVNSTSVTLTAVFVKIEVEEAPSEPIVVEPPVVDEGGGETGGDTGGDAGGDTPDTGGEGGGDEGGGENPYPDLTIVPAQSPQNSLRHSKYRR